MKERKWGVYATSEKEKRQKEELGVNWSLLLLNKRSNRLISCRTCYSYVGSRVYIYSLYLLLCMSCLTSNTAQVRLELEEIETVELLTPTRHLAEYSSHCILRRHVYCVFKLNVNHCRFYFRTWNWGNPKKHTVHSNINLAARQGREKEKGVSCPTTSFCRRCLSKDLWINIFILFVLAQICWKISKANPVHAAEFGFIWSTASPS